MKNIKLERIQSLLKELIPSALANLEDTRLNNLSVLEVKCSRGKYFAQVFRSFFYHTRGKKSYSSPAKKSKKYYQRILLRREWLVSLSRF